MVLIDVAAVTVSALLKMAKLDATEGACVE